MIRSFISLKIMRKTGELRVLSLLHDNYRDFGPTLAAEKLRERYNIRVSAETLRKWMTADGLWVPYSHRRPRVHQPRYRRDCLGELVQIDGSPHDWFVGRRWCVIHPRIRFCKVTQLLNDIQTYHILRHGGFYPKNSPAASDTAVCHFRRVQRHDFCPLWGLCHALPGNQT